MGSENNSDVEDTTEVDLDNSGDDTSTTSSGDDGKDAEAAAAAAAAKKADEKGEGGSDLAKILEEAGLDPKDPAAVKEAISAMSSIASKAGSTEALEKLLADSKELKDTKTAWAVQDELDKRAKEEPADTIARLDAERLERDKTRRDESEKANRSKEARKAMDFFDTTAEKAIDSVKDASDAEKSFLKKLLNSKNEMFDVDLSDRSAVNKLAADQGKMLTDLKTQIIQDYVDGKIEIPKVDKSTPAGFDKKGPKNLKEAETGARAYIRRNLPQMAKLLKPSD
jgi:hypothetical protein